MSEQRRRTGGKLAKAALPKLSAALALMHGEDHVTAAGCRFLPGSTMTNLITKQDAIEQFRSALASRNIIPPDVINGDGRIIRCGTTDRPRGKDAAVLLHLDDLPAGGYENHRDGLGWQKWRMDIGHNMTRSERNALKIAVTTARRERALLMSQRQFEASVRALEIWRCAQASRQDHPYLLDKAIRPHVAREHRGCLVVPVRDTEGRLWSLQFISWDGQKRFLHGGRKRGCYCPLGRPDGVICIAEGYATGASIREVTGHAVAIAFDAGNLLPVGEALRTKFPNIELRFFADDDRHTLGNPGLTCAIAAARAVSGTITLPRFREVWS